MNNIIISNKAKRFLGYFFCSLFLLGCTSNFEDYNRNPGQPTDEEIMVGYYKLGAFFPQMLNYAYPAQENTYQMGENLVGDPYGRYMAVANDGFPGDYSAFNPPLNWINSPFNDVFEKVYGGWAQIKTMTEGEGQLFAWAEIIRITAMQRLTDMYGPLPYSEIESGNLAVGYDTQEEVYKQMFDDLDKAIDVLTSFVEENPDYSAMANFDQVYQSDFRKWVIYANSLKLRMALRIVYADPVLAKQKAEEAVKHPMGVMTANEHNALNQFPQNPIWTVCEAWSDSRAAADIIAYMVGYNDPRLSSYFTRNKLESGGEYLGLRVGITIPPATITDNYSYPAFSRADATIWMMASEAAFNRAEGALRGWDMGGSAQEWYETGIRLSFEQWMAGGYDAYIADDTSTLGALTDPDPDLAAPAVSSITIKWSETDDFETKLERLITQKWIALFPLGQEAWSEQRRTGYPHFFPVLKNAGDDP
ncbi:MAG: SusD/RagB family nutrient-binding outer membrane lipoprotein [Tannerellaceae bacterium]|nr:SusD/RagB family nutrient-binding outer membrane lipoprotein [Tannerellaceae bacterium]